MIKRPFISFILIIGSLVLSTLWFIQRPQFASFLKIIAYRYIPKDIGIEGDFSELSITLFPPGFSINRPKINLGKHNIIKLPEGSSVTADRIDFTFKPFQIFSGRIGVHQVKIVNGKIHLILEQPEEKKKQTKRFEKVSFHWDELLQIHADSIALQNVDFDIHLRNSPLTFSGNACSLILGQWSEHGRLGYLIELEMKQLKSSLLKGLLRSESIDNIQAKARVSAAGVELESLLFKNSGIEVKAQGNLQGNLAGTSDLLLSGSFEGQGQLRKILESIQETSTHRPLPDGEMVLKGKFNGNLKKLIETLQIEGQLGAKKVSYKNWSFDQFEAEGHWHSSLKGGEVFLKKATLSSTEKDKKGESQPGQGGKIEIGSARWDIGTSSSLKIPVRLEKAHIHWLGAPAIKELYPLDFRVNGSIGLEMIPSKREKKNTWEIQANLATVLERFQLDNQKYLVKKPLHKTFEIPRIGIHGPIVMNSSGIRVNHLIASLPNSKLQVNGMIDFNHDSDLKVTGPVHLEDLNHIAESEIQGHGTVDCHIHGPSSRLLVDIDVDLKDGYYVGLKLGNIKGRITWDDDPSLLIFDHIKAEKALTHYSVEGQLDLGKKDQINLSIQIGKGHIQDIIQVFEKQTSQLSWFPKLLQGSLKGEVQVIGGIKLEDIQILAEVSGKDWEYLGEKFKQVDLVGGYDRGTYLISHFNVRKRVGKFLGQISYLPSHQKLDWKLKTHELTLNDIDYIAQLDVPIRGNLMIESQGQGSDGLIQSTSQFNLNNLTVRGLPMAPSQIHLQTEKDIARLQGSIMQGQGLLDMEYNFNSKETSEIHTVFRNLDFSPVLLLLNPKSIQDNSLSGRFSAELDLKFYSGSIERANGTLSVSEYSLARSDSRFLLAQPILVKLNNGNFEIKDLTIRGKQGEVSIYLKSNNTELGGKIIGELDTSIVEFFTPSIIQSSGTAAFDFTLGGILKSPTLIGNAKLQGGSVRVSGLDSSFENITGHLQLKQNVLYVKNLQSDLGGGRVSLEGRIELFPNRYPSIFLKSNLLGPRVKFYPFQFAKINGSLGINGSELPYVIDGNILVESALSREKIFAPSQKGSALKSLQYAPPPGRQGESHSSKFKLNLAVEITKGVQIQNELFRDVQIKGNLNLINTPEAPRILGKLETSQGKLLFKDHAFQIQNAVAIFDNPTVINPRFDLNASTELNATKIQMYATGRPDKIKIELTSNPAMQESEILSLLAVGLTSNDARKLSATDLTAVQQGEAASLVLHSLDFNRDLEDKTGFQVLLDQSVNTQQGISAFKPQSQSDAAAAPQITIRRKLGDRLSLSAGSTVGVGTNKSNQINLDYLINRDISVTGILNNFGTYGSTSSDTQNTQNSAQTFPYSFGLDLKFLKRFK